MMLRSLHLSLLLMAALAVAAPPAGYAAEADDAAKPAGNTIVPQVLVEGMVIEWQVNDDFDFGYALRYLGDPGATIDQIDLTLPSDPSLGSAARIFFDNMDVGAGTFDAYIEALERVGQVQILAHSKIPLRATEFDDSEDEPRINDSGLDYSKINNNDDPRSDGAFYRGRVENLTRIPYESTDTSGLRLVSVTEYKDTGVVLDVGVPAVYNDLVVLDVRASMDDLSGFINVGLNERHEPMRVPIAEARTIQNRLIVPDRRIYLAGLMKITRRSEQRSGIPWISELPVLNLFLSNRSDRYHDAELLFLVRPEVLTPYKLVDPEVAAAEEEE